MTAGGVFMRCQFDTAYAIVIADKLKINSMQLLDPLAIVFLAALIHASFQLSISVMTIMSGHALGKETAQTRVTELVSSFSLGGTLMIVFLLSFIALIAQNIAPHGVPMAAWGIACGLAIGVGIAIWAFYYQHRKNGTVLWIPRPLAEFLAQRARHTSLPIEAFSLGLTSVLAEIIFAIAPLLLAAFVLSGLPAYAQLGGLILYTFVASLPLYVITILVGSGKSLARIQRWRELNKRFLQFSAGSALIILGVYVYVDIVATRLNLGGTS